MNVVVNIFILSLFLTASVSFAKDTDMPLRDAFGKVGKTIESSSCPKDVIVDVSNSVTTLCTQSKDKQDDSDDVKYLKNADNTLSCDYENGIFQVTISNGSGGDTGEGDVQISIDETGKVVEISKDELKVDGATCRELAAKFDKGGRVPASADSELCFDYYPSSKLNVARVSSCTEAKKLTKKN